MKKDKIVSSLNLCVEVVSSLLSNRKKSKIRVNIKKSHINPKISRFFDKNEMTRMTKTNKFWNIYFPFEANNL